MKTRGFDFLQNTRIKVYFFLACFLPVIFSLFYLHFQFSNLKKLDAAFNTTQILAIKTLKQRKEKQAFLQKHQGASLSILKTLHGMPLLPRQISFLQDLQKHAAFFHNTNVAKRLTELDANQLRLNLMQTKGSSLVKEKTFSLEKSVFLDEKNLFELLSLVESNPKNYPQLFIQKFYLKKVSPPEGEEIFQLDMQLIQREFLKK